ncbi:hypothetical protein CS542_01790 [Pedobacter sp. IW39]|nr:hypothetical protein CS542_01790 [Pedobacter sp. IW39]
MKYFYEHTTLTNGGKIILEDSKATCPIGGPDCIKIIKHGQIAERGQNFKNAEPKVSKVLNPAVDPRAIIEEPVGTEGIILNQHGENCKRTKKIRLKLESYFLEPPMTV